MPPVDPSNGGLSIVPPARERRCPKRTAGGLCQSYLPRLDELLNSKLAHAAVKAASHFGRAQGDHSGQSKFKVHWNLSSTYPPPPSLPLSFFAFWVFLNGIFRISLLFLWCVRGRLFVAGNTFLSFLSLSLPLSFFPSLFPLFTLFLGCPWMLSS